jgi:hypothetical protein
MEYFYIYQMTNPETGEFYIGRRNSTTKPSEDILYRGSMVSWAKHDGFNKSKLIKTILYENIETFELLRELESNIISENIKNPLCRNAHIPNIGFYCKSHSLETREKMSKSKLNMSDETKLKISTSNKIRCRTEEFRLKTSINHKGKILSEETKQKISESSKGMSRTFSEEHRKNISNSLTGRKLSDDVKNKISSSLKGKKLSEETKQKISESSKNITQETRDKLSLANKGKIRSEETKQKIKESWKIRKMNSNK